MHSLSCFGFGSTRKITEKSICKNSWCAAEREKRLKLYRRVWTSCKMWKKSLEKLVKLIQNMHRTTTPTSRGRMRNIFSCQFIAKSFFAWTNFRIFSHNDWENVSAVLPLFILKFLTLSEHLFLNFKLHLSLLFLLNRFETKAIFSFFLARKAKKKKWDFILHTPL